MSFKIRRVVCPSQKLSHFPSLVFLAFLHEVRGNGVEKSDGARFLKKKCLGPNLGKKGPKWAKNEVFGLFLEQKS